MTKSVKTSQKYVILFFMLDGQLSPEKTQPLLARTDFCRNQLYFRVHMICFNFSKAYIGALR